MECDALHSVSTRPVEIAGNCRTRPVPVPGKGHGQFDTCLPERLLCCRGH